MEMNEKKNSLNDDCTETITESTESNNKNQPDENCETCNENPIQPEKKRKRLTKRNYIILLVLFFAVSLITSEFTISLFLIYAIYCFYKRFGGKTTIGCCLGSSILGLIIAFLFVSFIKSCGNGLISSLFEKKDKDGSIELSLGLEYYSGDSADVEHSKSIALEYFHKSAKKGNPTAMTYIGECYYNGSGVEQSYIEALNWFHKSADLGESGAMTYIGECYFNGNGAEQSYEKAIKWYEKAAQKGNVAAKRRLAICYMFGYGVEPDLEKAKMWAEEAKEQEETHKEMIGIINKLDSFVKTRKEQADNKSIE